MILHEKTIAIGLRIYNGNIKEFQKFLSADRGSLTDYWKGVLDTLLEINKFEQEEI